MNQRTTDNFVHKFKLIVLVILVLSNLFGLYAVSTVVTPFKTISLEDDYVRRLQVAFKIDKQLARNIYTAAVDYQFDPIFIGTLILTESKFNPDAVSEKGYKGLMQTKTKTGYNDVDIRHGLAILKEKLEMANGDMETALMFYKGGVTEEGKVIALSQARHVLQLYNRNKI